MIVLMPTWKLRIDKCRVINWLSNSPHIYSCFPWWFTLHQRDKHQSTRWSPKSKRPSSLNRLAVDVGKEKEREGIGERSSAQSDQYSNCKMNLTGARTSHQMGKEIGYERWPAIKSDIPQCHLSDTGRGIMTTANESWALVRRWFKSAPCSGRLFYADSVPCPLVKPAGCHQTTEKFWHFPKSFQTWPDEESDSLWYYSGPERCLKPTRRSENRTAVMELMEMKDLSAV